MKVLISGFEAFDGRNINVSQEVLPLLKSSQCELYTALLPVEFKQSWIELEKKIKELNPDWVIALGEAAPRTKISLERVAVNLLDARIPDHTGYQPKDEVISVDGANAIFTHVPVRKIFDELGENYPLEISLSAGSYVCNYLMYKTLESADRLGYRGGFIHLPLVKDQNPDSEFEVNDIAESLNRVLNLLNDKA